MANTKSAEKRILISKRNCLQNKSYKNAVRTLTKSFLKDLNNYERSKNSIYLKNAENLLNSIFSLIDKSAKKKVFHKNLANRKKSKLSLKLKILKSKFV